MRVLAERLREEMARREIQCKALSRATGISKNMLSRIRNDRSDPTATTIATLARALGVSADWLLGLSERKRR